MTNTNIDIKIEEKILSVIYVASERTAFIDGMMNDLIIENVDRDKIAKYVSEEFKETITDDDIIDCEDLNKAKALRIAYLSEHIISMRKCHDDLFSKDEAPNRSKDEVVDILVKAVLDNDEDKAILYHFLENCAYGMLWDLEALHAGYDVEEEDKNVYYILQSLDITDRACRLIEGEKTSEPMRAT